VGTVAFNFHARTSLKNLEKRYQFKAEMAFMKREIWMTAKAVMFDRKVVFPSFVLLAVVSLDFLFHGRALILELDSFEHFLFGFVLSETVSKSSRAMRFNECLLRKLNKGNGRQADLLIRLFGFLLIGGLVWECSQWLLFPLFGAVYNPFFKLPVTLRNIDGAMDVTVGVLGCVMAWFITSK